MRRFAPVLVGVVALLACALAVSAQGVTPPADPQRMTPLAVPGRADVAQLNEAARVTELAARVARLETRVDRGAGTALAFLFGAFCALWAQNTKRSAVQWFFLGAIFSVIAVLVVLAKNADDLKQAGGAPPQSRTVVLAVVLGVLLVVLFVFLYLGSMTGR
jgi:hypothetical protein